MNIAEFNAQMKRLSDTFGPQHFKQERLNLIFASVRDFTPEWLRRTVDNLIANSRHAPLPGEFSEAASQERERQWQAEKARNRTAAEDFWSGQTFGEGDRRLIFDAFVARMKFNKHMRQMEMAATTDDERADLAKTKAKKDAEWESFVKMLKETEKKRLA